MPKKLPNKQQNQKLNQLNQKLELQTSQPNLQKKILGNKGEQLVKNRLLEKDWQFISQNFRIRNGEIDLIFLDHETLVFIEVKTRTNPELGHPEEAITPRKLANIRHTAQVFLLENPIYKNHLFRIDIAAIDYSDKNNPIRYYKNVY